MGIFRLLLVIWVGLLGVAVILGAIVQHQGAAASWWLRWTNQTFRLLTIVALRVIGMIIILPVAVLVRAYDHANAQGQRQAQIAVGVIVLVMALAVYGAMVYHGIIPP